MENRTFYDIESGEVIAIEQLFNEFSEMVGNGEVDRTFGEYVWDCQTFNGGTLKEIR